MKILKKFLSIALALLLLLSFAGCHAKGEIAVKAGDMEFTSAYYLCALIFADMEARSIVESDMAEEIEEGKEINYYKQKVEDTDYVKWVEEKALHTIKAVAAYKTLCTEKKVEIEDDVIASAESMAEFYWDSYGYSQLFEPNGVSETTFNQYMVDSYYADLYFEHVYGEDGEKEISKDDVKNTISSKFALINKITASFEEGTSEDDIKALKETFVDYEKALSSGKKTFKEVYVDYNGEDAIEEEEHEHEEGEEAKEPLDSLSELVGNDDTDYAYEHFDKVSKLKTGEVTLITEDDNKGLVLIVKKNVLDDPYYVELLDLSARKLIAGEDFEKEMDEYSKGIDFEVIDNAVSRLKVKNIKYDVTQ